MPRELAEINAALRAQDWALALSLCRVFRDAGGARGEHAHALALAEADALRGMGQLAAARDAYRALIGAGAERVRALHGLAACHLAVGDAAGARVACERALAAGAGQRSLELRIAATHARALARTDLAAGIEALEAALGRPAPAGSARANARLRLGEILLDAGEYERARRQLAIAHSEAAAADASRTFADVLRRQATLAVMAADKPGIAAALTELPHAERIYEGLGDAGGAALALARGEGQRHLGHLAMAERDLRQAAWQANAGRDQLTHAHALLALADTRRLVGDHDPEPIRRAEAIYRRLDLAWGLFHARLALAAGAAAAGRPADADAALAAARDLLEQREPALGAPAAAALASARAGAPGPIALSHPA